MLVAKPPTGQGNQEVGGGDDQRNFWHPLKAHYSDHVDVGLLVAIVENGQFNKYLTINAQEHVRVTLRKHVILLSKLQPPTDVLPYLCNQMECISTLYHCFMTEECTKTSSKALNTLINTSAAIHNQEEFNLAAQKMMQQNSVGIEELQPNVCDDESENEDGMLEDDPLSDDELDVNSVASDVSEETPRNLPAIDINVQPYPQVIQNETQAQLPLPSLSPTPTIMNGTSLTTQRTPILPKIAGMNTKAAITPKKLVNTVHKVQRRRQKVTKIKTKDISQTTKTTEITVTINDKTALSDVHKVKIKINHRIARDQKRYCNRKYALCCI